MLIEAESIPYHPAPLRGERLLVLAPHPDDEVIGCGGLIALHLKEGRKVRVVVATDGSKATGATAGEDYKRTRERESRSALEQLGPVDLAFLGFPDRELDDRVQGPLRDQLLSFKPDLICVPSPIEVHPDHFALARAFCGLVQSDDLLHAQLAIARVAFYEVSQPLRPNTLVDITEVAEAKYTAIAAHQSQIVLKDYVAYARGLNAYRAMTLPPESKAAEAYWVLSLPELRTTPLSDLRKRVGHPPPIESVREAVPVTVVIRTKDRPAQLREAIESVRSNEYRAETIVVNDAGQSVDLEGVRVINHPSTRGRSEAMNSGVRAATTRFVAFLDDDDLYYPEHLATLANAVNSAGNKAAWYTDAVSAFLRPGPSGAYETYSRLRLFGDDFDREALLIDNYIPVPTLLVEREAFLDVGGFDPAFDLFEDWDFLIRLSERGDFLHVPRITCEIRHFQGGGSIVMAAPEGTDRFRAAKLQVWKKHADRIDNNVFANVYERKKHQLAAVLSALVEEKGARSLADRDIARIARDVERLERDKAALIAERPAWQDRIRELEHSLSAEQTASAAVAVEKASLQAALDEAHSALRLSHAEASRLQALLDMIYRSRTWKLHTIVEKMKGRG
jgi:LmbE family N-acetylglucosaminyl deacetylase